MFALCVLKYVPKFLKKFFSCTQACSHNHPPMLLVDVMFFLSVFTFEPKTAVVICLRLNIGYVSHTPEMYLSYFLSHGVTDVIRLNNKVYAASRFTSAGISHHDLYFVDGSVPTDDILARFLHISEKAPGAIAVHCKGLFTYLCNGG